MAYQILDTHVGRIELENGYPSRESVSKLYDEFDFQRAVQAYIWAMPIVALDSLRASIKRDFGTDYNRIIIAEKFSAPAIMALTASNATIYATSFVDVSNGPIVIEAPPGVDGVVDDYWQRLLTEIGLFGPDAGRGGKFVVVPPAYNRRLPPGCFFVHSSTNRVFFFARAATKRGEAERAVDRLSRIRIYPLSRSRGAKSKNFRIEGKIANPVAPRGFEYWQHLADIFNREPIEDRDRFFHAMLKPLGLEKGRPFAPDARQARILTEATELGSLMTQTMSMAPRHRCALAYPGTHWDWVSTLNADREARDYDLRDERNRASEAVTIPESMVKPPISRGTQCMSAAKDQDSAWLDGGVTYRLHVPPDVPVREFWSIAVYDNVTRAMIQTDTGKAALSSSEPLKVKPDGSIDIFFGPRPYESIKTNWIETIPERGWFAYFRWYGPTQAFFDKSWTLPDITKI